MFGKGTLGRKLLGVGAFTGVVGAAGGYSMYKRRLAENRAISAEDFNSKQNPAELEWAFKNLFHKTDHPVAKFYRYTTCPWCGTVKAFLDCYKVPHECVEVEPMFKKELNESEYKKVPQLRFDKQDGAKGPFLVDSKLIVDRLAKEMGIEKQLVDPEVNEWRNWARGPLVRLITLEFNRSLKEAWSGYSYIDSCDTIPYANKLFLKVVGAPVMYLVAMKMTKPRLIKDGFMTEGDDVKVKLHEHLNRFSAEALVDPKTKKPRTFHGGNKPDLADLDTFGVLQSVRGHRVYDAIIRETNLRAWLTEMDKVTGNKEYTI